MVVYVSFGLVFSTVLNIIVNNNLYSVKSWFGKNGGLRKEVEKVFRRGVGVI